MAKSKREANPTEREANKYDKIIKENLVQAIPGLMYLFVGFKIADMEVIKMELQHTLEVKADFMAVVTDSEGKRFVLHIEFQLDNDR